MNNRSLRWCQYVLWVAGITSLGYVGFDYLKAARSQHLGSIELQRTLENNGQANDLKFHPIAGSVFGLVQVPRLGMSLVAFEGTDEDILDRGAGHVMESSALSGVGNVVLAGHRDTFFRPLREIRIGDEIRVQTAGSERTYTVESTHVVAPTDVSVMDPTSEAMLTLITCYPFRYVGPAPNRFIVRARERSSGAVPAVTVVPTNRLPRAPADKLGPRVSPIGSSRVAALPPYEKDPAPEARVSAPLELARQDDSPSKANVKHAPEALHASRNPLKMFGRVFHRHREAVSVAAE